MKKEKSRIIVLDSPESTSDESERELPIENTEELKEYLLNDDNDDNKIIKQKSPKKRKKLAKKRETSSGNSVDQDQEKSVKPKKSTQKYLLKGDDFKRLQKKAKKLGATSLDYSKRKNNIYIVEYNGKKIHFGSANTEDFIIHKDPDQRNKYRTKAMKITNKDGELTYQIPSYPNYWSIKLLN